MNQAIGIFVLAAAALCSGACDEAASSTPLEFTGEAVESLPQVEEASADGSAALEEGLLARAPATAGTIADYSQLGRLFKLECHLYPDVNYCPATVDVAENGGMNGTKFSLDSLLGSIYTGQMYSGGHKTACELARGAVSAGSFVAAAAGGDPAKYVVDTYALLECRGVDDLGAVVAYSIDPAYQATLTARHRAIGTEGTEMTDIFQVYVGLSRGAPTLLAFNFAGISGGFGRTVLIVNLVTHRFAVKNGGAGIGIDYRYVNAVGQGGVNRTTGAPYPGRYFARFSDDAGTDTTACVNNVGGLIEASNDPCTAEGVPVAWDGADSVAAYLGLSIDERARLAGFLDILSDSEPLSADDVPQSLEEADTSFPASIE